MNIRAIELTDDNAYLSILERTSEEDRYCRFFHVINHFTKENISKSLVE